MAAPPPTAPAGAVPPTDDQRAMPHRSGNSSHRSGSASNRTGNTSHRSGGGSSSRKSCANPSPKSAAPAPALMSITEDEDTMILGRPRICIYGGDLAAEEGDARSIGVCASAGSSGHHDRRAGRFR